ncbi:MAG TPA: DUF3298 domain-containing protein [Flavobacterium sp.]|uniref:DUF3298 and DUF4163 domain-containing protein n=1 Tax=Flavobacterium sp. TaxID=239 RepID=UPI002C07BE2C|nr:DUF3298 domain-containing protein [Flavobacterium sp.]HSD13837.1 DUF3298 domain-containing protein [Flavobacterium sp.]
MRNVFLLVFAALSLFSCKKEELNFKTKKFHKEFAQKSDTTIIEIEVDVAQNKSEAADSINTLFLKEINFLFSFDSTKTTENYPEICAQFIKEYVDFRKEMPEYATPWDANAMGKIAYQSEKLLNLTIDYYSFTGGAHGNGGSRSFFADPETGKRIKKEDLFSDFKGFVKLAEQKFRKQQKIPARLNINETGYWFEKDAFHLPENIFYTDKGILLLYNQYEIASYAEGPIELIIPYSEADKFLKIK